MTLPTGIAKEYGPLRTIGRMVEDDAEGGRSEEQDARSESYDIERKEWEIACAELGASAGECRAEEWVQTQGKGRTSIENQRSRIVHFVLRGHQR
jgi:hypothetical protein